MSKFRTALKSGGIALLALTVLAAMGPSGVARADVKTDKAWVRAATAKVHAGYMTLVNDKNKAADLVGASSPQYQRAELHLSKVEGGVATMVKQDQITIPAGGRLEMKPGGFHIMLMRPKAPVKVGDNVDITLSFADGSTIQVAVPVKGATGMPMKPDHHHMHGGPKTN